LPREWPHPVFERFSRGARGDIPNWLGVRTRREFFSAELGFVTIGTPPVDTEILEWIDLLEAVIAADARFTMIELGAGYGRWIVNAAAAVRAYHGDLPMRLVAVEAEPTHFRWLKRHCSDNGVKAKLIRAAVAHEEGDVAFAVGNPAGWYGQAIADGTWSPDRVERVRAVTLSSLLAPFDEVDLIHLDVQGAEFDVLEEAASVLHRVRRVHVGTHSQKVENGIRRLFTALGWTAINDHPSGSASSTPFGVLDFQDGVQTWARPV
jgi:FkbM family methyltransferase